MNARRADIPVPGVLSEADAVRVEATVGPVEALNVVKDAWMPT